MKTYEPTYEEIEQRARENWTAQGQPVGRDEEIWLQAEQQLRSRKGTSNVRSSAARAADAAPKSIEEEVDPIENDPIEERLSQFGEPRSRGATSL
jgi:Protein of unknown function (DUF2934)